jgi:hypothetical protein
MECIERLKAMIEPEQSTWDLSPQDVEAIRAVLAALAERDWEVDHLKRSIALTKEYSSSEIERLKTEVEKGNAAIRENCELRRELAVARNATLRPNILRCPRCGLEKPENQWHYVAHVGPKWEGLRCPDCFADGYSAIPEPVAAVVIESPHGRRQSLR